jgi:hypothetical protein
MVNSITDAKVCTRCHVEKPVTDFYFLKSRNSYEYQCKKCHSERKETERRKDPTKNRDRILRWYKKNRELILKRDKLKRIQRSATQIIKDKQIRKAKHIKLKTRILQAYGGPMCVCCGESDINVLTIDHLNNNGSEHRSELFGKRNGCSVQFYHWLIRNNFPKEYQVLCSNCNLAKHINGGSLPDNRRNQILSIRMFNLDSYIKENYSG